MVERHHPSLESGKNSFVSETIYLYSEAQNQELLASIYDFWARQDRQTVEFRFGCNRVPIFAEYQKILSHAVVVVTLQDHDQKLIGYAEACQISDKTGEVEIAVVIDEHHRCQGLGLSIILDLAQALAQLPEIKRIHAQIDPQNHSVTKLIQKIKCHYPLTTKYRDGLLNVDLEIQ